MKKLNKKLSELIEKETYLHANLENILFDPTYEYFNEDLISVKAELNVIKEQIMILLKAKDILEN